jgi:hypothetical protein
MYSKLKVVYVWHKSCESTLCQEQMEYFWPKIVWIKVSIKMNNKQLSRVMIIESVIKKYISFNNHKYSRAGDPISISPDEPEFAPPPISFVQS